MWKENKRVWLLTAALVLAPVLVGLAMWDSLPNTMVTHWNAQGVADGWSGKGFAVFVLPLILLAFHGLCLLATTIDKKNQNQSKKALRMVLWIMPVTSWFSCGSMYAAALGKDMEFLKLVPVFMGVLFAIMGNYMPKVKQNRTLGVKLPWTLANEENWNKTHRYCGRLWVIGGLVIALSVLLPKDWCITVMTVTIITVSISPILYSLKLYRIHQRQGVAYDFKPKGKGETIAKRVSIVAVVLILAGTAALMFTGEIEYAVTDEGLEIEATYWADSFVTYEEMDAVEFRENYSFGIRTNGFGSAKLSMGAFRNEEFGSYTLYAYNRSKSVVVITSGKRILVLSAASEAETQQLYEQLLAQTK